VQPRFGRTLAAALLLTASTALAEGAPHDVRPRIVNGVYTSDHPTVGLLLTGSGPDTADSECTGTLIGCRTFLTAAHCVCSSVGRRCQGDDAPDPSQLFVFLQHAGVFAVERVAVHPAYVFPVADLAVVHLAEPVTAITPTAINREATPGFGTRGTIVGFGRSGLGNYDYGLKRVGKMRTAACDGDPGDPTWVCWNFDPPVGAPGTDSNICNGDSGGPLFTASDCGDHLAGVTSGAIDAECAAPDRPFDINVFHYREWIAAETGADLDGVTCGPLRHVGESGTEVDGFVGEVSAASPEGHHTISVSPGAAELRVTMNAVDMGAENFDLYVRPGAAPTPDQFACADTGTSQFADCVVSDPVPGPWHLMARRVTGEGTYQITATTIGAGAPASSGSGHCNDGSACTVTDRCLRERCVGTAAPDGTPCDDARLCTASETRSRRATSASDGAASSPASSSTSISASTKSATRRWRMASRRVQALRWTTGSASGQRSRSHVAGSEIAATRPSNATGTWNTGR
jgi:hypothetical protein